MLRWRVSSILLVVLAGCSKDAEQCPCPAVGTDAGLVSQPALRPPVINSERFTKSEKSFMATSEAAKLFASAEEQGRVFDLGGDWDKIIHSHPDMMDLFPWVVAVGAPGAWRCSGIAIAPDRVLTAFHCATDGFVSIGGVAGQSGRIIEVIDIDKREALDLKVLKLKSSIKLKSRMKLAGACVQNRLTFPMTVRLVGFGLQRADGLGLWGTRTFGESTLRGLSCAGATHPRPCRDANEFAMSSDGESDTCEGDSGGPLLASWKGEDVIVAITSRPIDGQEGCGRGGIYVKVWSDIGWLRNHGALVTKCP